MSSDNSSLNEYKLIDTQIGLLGGTVLLIGTALGMSIFIVPTQMAALAGPAITVAILASIVPMILGVLLLLQLGGAIPVAGGIYVYASRLVGPYWGLVGVLIPILAIWSYLIFAALGFAQYVRFLVPELPVVAAAWLLLGAFLVINYFGIRLVTQVQLALVTVLLLGMLSFVVTGSISIDTANYTPLFPGELYESGLGPLLVAIVTLYIPLQGFGMVIEIGEELENPIKNIPRVLALGMGIVTAVTISIIVVLVGAVPWQEAIGPDGQPIEGGLAEISTAFAPEWVSGFIAIAALIAAATTVNTLFTSYSRTVMRAARDEIIPGYFAAVHETHSTPYRAILLLGVPAFVLTPVVVYIDALVAVEALDWLVVIVVAGTLIAFMMAGFALWRLPKVFPQRYEYSIYKLPMPVLRVVAVGNVVVSFVFILFVAAGMPSALGTLIAALLLGYVGYRYRLRVYAKRDIDLKARMALLHKHEQVGGSDD